MMAQLSDALDGAPGAGAVAAVLAAHAQHLAECSDCRARADGLVADDAALREMARLPDVPRCTWLGEGITTLYGTMPAIQHSPGATARPLSVLPMPFCSDSTGVPGGKVAASSDAACLVAPHLTVSSTKSGRRPAGTAS